MGRINQNVSTTLEVAFVIYENALSTAISLPIELLTSASNIAKAAARSPSSTRAYPKLNIRIASVDGSAKMSQTGIEIPASCAIADIETADVVFLPAMWRNPAPVVDKNNAICLWIKSMFSRETTRLAGVGTGCYFLAEAGILDNRVATTHWYFFEQFEKRYPKIKLERNYFITQSGRLYCTGSVNTLADLTVHFIDQYYGEAVSTEVERHFFHDIRRNYHKLALLDDSSKLHYDEAIAYAQSHIGRHYHEQISIDSISKSTGMSRRNFDRRFKKAVGVSPLAYLQQTRIDTAQDLLKNSNLSVSEIMYQVGYQDTAHFSRLFKKKNGTTPRQYRSTVRAKLFQSSD